MGYDAGQQASGPVKQNGEEESESAEVSTPVNPPVVTSIRVETYGIDYELPETLEPFDITSWFYSQYYGG